MTIATVSISYRTAPAESMAQLVVPPAEQSRVLAHLSAVSGVDEVLLLSTCNRVEVYAATATSAADTCHAVAAVLADRAGVPVDDVMTMTRQFVGGAAVEHLLSVACGLESMAIGEDQIVAQVRAAGRDAASAGASGAVLRGLLDAALHTSKRARRETGIGTAGVSLAQAGLDLARDHLGADLGRRHAVVVGAGTMGRLAARLLHQAGVGQLSITSRTATHAAELAGTVGGRPLAAARWGDALAAADIVVAATAAPAPVVRLADVRRARRSSGPSPLFVLDLGQPPNVETGVRQLPDVVLADLTALGQHLSATDGPDEVPQVRAIIAAEAAAFLARQEQAATAPVIAALHAQIRTLADAELARLERRLPGLDDRQRAETAATVHRILRKVLHQPTVRVRELGTGSEGQLYVEALRRLFDLPGPG
jgi:glutamyl-tRNA reductase